VAARRSPILVTGAAGFGGSHLVEHLLETGADVVALDHPDARLDNLGAVLKRIEHLPCDLAAADAEEIGRLLGPRDLGAVYHLAGLASVRRSWEDVRRTLEVNALGTLNLLGALQRRPRPPAVLLVGSAEEYGVAPGEGTAVVEDAPLAPVSPYALSKVWQEALGGYFARLERWPIHLTRTFNHTGARQSPDFVCSDFARQIARIEFRLEEPVIRVGDLTVARDFLDVRDVVGAYRLVVERGRAGVAYNVCSGRAWTIAELLNILLGHAVLKIKVEVDFSRRRPVDIPVLLGDPGRLKADTGWTPRYAMEECLRDLLEYWRVRTAEEAEGQPPRRARQGASRETG
jgi:GDP-4-dehydro-6-deoxy-D-mannose reductase